MVTLPARRLRWSSLALPVLVLLLGTCAYGYRWLTPTLPFISGSDLRHVGNPFHAQVPLQTEDEILQIDGRTPDEWAQAGLAGLHYLAASYHVTISRNGAIRTVEVAAEYVPLRLGLLWWSSALALGLATLFVSALVGLVGGRGPGEQGLRLAFLGLGLYLLCAIPLVGAPPLSWVFEPLLIPVQIIGIGLTSGIAVFFLCYPRPVLARHPYVVPLVIYSTSLVSATVALLLSPDDLLARSTVVTRQIVNSLAIMHALLAIGLGIRTYRNTRSPVVRAQFRWLLWGGIVGPTPWLILWAVPIALLNDPLVPFPALVMFPCLALPFSFALAILRYRLLDVDTVLSRTLVYLLLSLALGGIYALVIATTSQLVPHLLGINDKVIFFLATLLCAALFSPALRIAQHMVDRVCYRGRYVLLNEIDSLRRDLRNVAGWETLLPLLNRHIPQRLGIDRAQLLLWENDQFVPPRNHGAEDGQSEARDLHIQMPTDWPLERPLMLQNWEQANSGEVLDNPDQDDADLRWGRSLRATGYQLAFILVAGGRPVGLYALGRQFSGDWYERSVIAALGSLADRVAGAVENARLLEQTAAQARLRHELTIAQNIQRSLLPEGFLRHGHLEVATLTLPASDVGGDLSTVQPLSKGSLAAAVGDVSGKGIGAALLMAVTSAMLRTMISEGESPPRLLARLDQLLQSYTAQNNQNVALCYLHLYSTRDADYRLLAASAGAIPLLVRRANSRLEWLEMEGLPLGTGLETPFYKTVVTSLHPGDVVVICTDGLIEARNAAGTLLSFSGIECALAQVPMHLSAQAIVQHLLTAMQDHVNGSEAEDDVTIMVIRVE